MAEIGRVQRPAPSPPTRTPVKPRILDKNPPAPGPAAQERRPGRRRGQRVDEYA